MKKLFVTGGRKNNSVKYFDGFTLTEILITLLIIGVVAAITIPVLVTNIQDWQFKETAKEAFSKASQAIQQMKQDNGGDLTYYYGNTNSFKPIFMTYFKIIKDCNWSGCVASSTSSTVYKSLHGDAGFTCYMSGGQFITNDGIFWGIQNNSVYGVIYITVDVNGYTKGPNVFGRDTFIFQLLNDNLVPMGSNNTDWIYYCDKTVSSYIEGFTCMDYVMRGVNY